jgi:molybdenum cofactor cytidylyltransferase
VISAILLAAGESKRILKENKLVKIYKGKPLINHILKSLIKSKIQKIIIILGHEKNKVKKTTLKSKKISFAINKNYKKGISSSIKLGIKKIHKKNKGFIIVQADMPFVKSLHINKIYNSLSKKNNLIHVMRFKNIIGNPIGFKTSVISKFRKISGDIGAKYMVKRLKKDTHFIKIGSNKIFKDLDFKKDFSS